MRSRVVALHGFLGRGADWDAVRAASRAGLEWVCPDLFARGSDASAPLHFSGKAWLAGYSFGGRLALRWMERYPERWHGALLVSVNPGNFQSEDERTARREADGAWARAFRAEPWDALMARWDAQAVFAGSAAPLRAEADFDREKLAAALGEFSVAGQFADPLRLRGAIAWLAGEKDEKFLALLGRMRDAGFPGVFSAVPGVGHRLLHDAPEAVAEALDFLVATR